MSKSRFDRRRSAALPVGIVLLTTLSATVVSAQLTNPGTRRTAPTSTAAPPNPANIGAQAILPDLVAALSGPASIIESYSDENPCTAHSHTHVMRVQLGGRFLPTYPTVTATLFRNGQPLATWTIATAGRAPPVNLGSFSWTRDHPCPDGSTSISYSPPPQNNHRLVVDANGAQEVSGQNNALDFHVPPDGAWANAQ